jgi:predicted extracellular nuclease
MPMSKRFAAWLCALALPFAFSVHAEMRITEYMYNSAGSGSEFVEFTNVGSTPVDMTGWSFDDDSEHPGTVDLSEFGVVAPGQSVILTDNPSKAAFRAAWSLCDDVVVIAGNSAGLGRDDEINLFDASGTLVDRLRYGDDTIGGPRTSGVSAYVSAQGLGANDIADWTLSVVGDAEHSRVSTDGDIGSPGMTTRGSTLFTACPATQGEIRVTEYMYQGNDGEFVEFTNVGGAPVDMTGWSFDDDSETPGTVPLSGFGTIAPGESAILTETEANAFRAAWSLCAEANVVGGNMTGLGRADEINLFSPSGQLADRLKYDDQTLGGPRTNGASAWVSAAGLGANVIADWTLSTVGDTEHSTTSADGDIGSPGASTRATVPFSACPAGAMRITEYMYNDAGDGEFIEFTNVGTGAVDMSHWSFSDSGETVGDVDLSDFHVVAPGESVILTQQDEDAFRDAWHLCSAAKVIGGNTTNLGRADEINLYDASGAQIDRLTYDDQTLGGPRTNGISAWVSAAGLGNNIITDWTLSAIGDGEASIASTVGDIGSPGKSSRALVAFDPCAGSAESPVVSVDPLQTSFYLDLAPTGSGTVSGVIGDITDPAATDGIGFAFALADGGDGSALTIAASSDNLDVVADADLALAGDGPTRQLTIRPRGVGYATITVSATDAANNVGTYLIHYAASAPPLAPEATSYHTGASDASATEAIDDERMFVADDETNTIRLYRRDVSGLPIAGFDVSSNLALTDPDNPELDIEGSTRIGDRLFWTTSYSNSKNFHVRPNRHRVFSTDLSGTGDAATLTYVGRYDWLLEDMVAWDDANGHGLGAGYLGFAAGSAEGVDSKTPEGFNIEGLSIAPDDSTAYFAFRAPLLPTNDRHQAVIVPVLNFEALVDTAAPDSMPQGSATFGAPIFLDLGGRGIRSLDRNASGQYLITAGPTGDASGIAPSDFRLFAWTGNPADAPFDLGLDMTAIDIDGGSFESIAGLPDVLGPGAELQFLFDNGDSVWYGDGVAAKDLPDPRLQKAASLRVTVDVAFPAVSATANLGTPQSATVDTTFASTLAVRVVDAYGNGVPNVAVAFAAPASGASATFSTASLTTDAKGLAGTTATANAIAGAYTATATVAGIPTPVAFALTNVAGAATTLVATSGTPQSATVGDLFAMPLSIHVTDAEGNAVAGASVSFAAPTSGASAALSSTNAATDANGDADITATANATAGSYEVVATMGESTATFALTNTAGAPANIVVVGGTPQTTIVGNAFANPLVARVTDAGGNPLAGITVTFAVLFSDAGAGATIAPETAMSDANGEVSVIATANEVAGNFSVSANFDGGTVPAVYLLTSTIDPAETIFASGFDP